ncbi:MAG: type VI secretion system baseplate subunit TssG [Phycisphaerales bacterium]|nr:MAG: type VI secretion system baseplate subunit TssG [Phycisphaerales bacterium]
MAAPSRRAKTSVIVRLREDAQEFEFTQAVRILQRIGGMAERSSSSDAGGFASDAALPTATKPVGKDAFPNREVVRFRSSLSFTFPAGEIAQVSLRDNGVHETREASASAFDGRTRHNGGLIPNDMTISFLGITGPSGALPLHYTTELMSRARERDTATQEFFDLFHHRLASLFYRAAEKNCTPLRIEHEMLRGREHNDVFTKCLWGIVGLGTNGLRNRLGGNEQSVLYFSGHFARSPKSAAALKGLLVERFGVQVSIEQFRGQWLPLPADGQSFLGEAPGSSNGIGVDLICGEWVWDVQSRFRIRLGPLRLKRFIDFTPAGQMLRDLWTLVRLYVGTEFDFEVQPILYREDVPLTQLGSDRSSTDGARLGWTTWLRSHKDVISRHFDGAVFEINDMNNQM